MPGYAIGGLSGGEEKDKFWRVVAQCCCLLPADKPIYCMGVGYALDMVVCVALGVDMFDCVFPTRTARFGSALVPSGQLTLRHQQYAADFCPIDATCRFCSELPLSPALADILTSRRCCITRSFDTITSPLAVATHARILLAPTCTPLWVAKPYPASCSQYTMLLISCP